MPRPKTATIHIKEVGKNAIEIRGKMTGREETVYVFKGKEARTVLNKLNRPLPAKRLKAAQVKRVS